MYEFEDTFRLLQSAHPRLDSSSCPQTWLISCQSPESQLTATSSIHLFVIKVILDSSFCPTPYSFSQENLLALPVCKTYIDPTTCHHLHCHHPIPATILSYQDYLPQLPNSASVLPPPPAVYSHHSSQGDTFKCDSSHGTALLKTSISLTPKTKSHCNGLQGHIGSGLCHLHLTLGSRHIGGLLLFLSKSGRPLYWHHLFPLPQMPFPQISSWDKRDGLCLRRTNKIVGEKEIYAEKVLLTILLTIFKFLVYLHFW